MVHNLPNSAVALAGSWRCWLVSCCLSSSLRKMCMEGTVHHAANLKFLKCSYVSTLWPGRCEIGILSILLYLMLPRKMWNRDIVDIVVFDVSFDLLQYRQTPSSRGRMVNVLTITGCEHYYPAPPPVPVPVVSYVVWAILKEQAWFFVVGSVSECFIPQPFRSSKRLVWGLWLGSP